MILRRAGLQASGNALPDRLRRTTGASPTGWLNAYELRCETVVRAVDRVGDRFSFRDALIVEAALRGGADLLLSEDMQDGRIVEGMRIENPFT
ncbi:MAG: hypothetical protein H0U65_03550 [Rubrobacter sp.]|nr:hypothetical protein [Rubrobacter sp.]